MKTPSGLNLVTRVSLGLKVSLKQDVQPAVTLTSEEWLCSASENGRAVGSERLKLTPMPPQSPRSTAVHLSEGWKWNAVPILFLSTWTFHFWHSTQSRKDSLTPLWQQKHTNIENNNKWDSFPLRVDSNHMALTVVLKCNAWITDGDSCKY